MVKGLCAEVAPEQGEHPGHRRQECKGPGASLARAKAQGEWSVMGRVVAEAQLE